MNSDRHPYADRDPRALTEGEWRILTNARLEAVENTLAGIRNLGRTILIAVIGGVLVFWLTSGGPH